MTIKYKLIIKYIFAAVFAVSFNYSIAANKVGPTIVPFNDNEQVLVDLSRNDINRIFVKNEKVLAINAPSGLLSAHNDQYGSIYVNVYSQHPFTAYVTTSLGRHFSLLITPKSEPGQTVSFQPKTIHKHTYKRLVHHYLAARRFEHASDYEDTLVKLTRYVMQGNTPPGYARITKHALASLSEFKLPEILNTNSKIKEKVTAIYLGGDLAIRVVKVDNMTKRAVTLVANEFYRSGIRAVSIEKEHLLPHESSQIVEVISNV